MTLNETWSVARDQSTLGGSVPRLTRKTFSCACSEVGAQDHRTRTRNNACRGDRYDRREVFNVEVSRKKCYEASILELSLSQFRIWFKA
jgi:hypothetical protein